MAPKRTTRRSRTGSRTSAAREQLPDTAEIVEAPSAAESATKTPRGEPVSSEPVLERVVMTPHADGAR